MLILMVILSFLIPFVLISVSGMLLIKAWGKEKDWKFYLKMFFLILSFEIAIVSYNWGSNKSLSNNTLIIKTILFDW